MFNTHTIFIYLMLLTILFTVFICGVTQMLISHPNKCYSLVLYFSRLSLLKKYVPQFNKIMEYYSKYYCKPDNRILNNNVFSSNDNLLNTDSPIDLFTPLNTPLNSVCLNNRLNKEKSFEDTLKEYEEKHSTKVIIINHKRNDSQFGLDFLAQQQTLGLEDSKKFVDIIRNISDDTNITLIINTPGGSLAAAEIIIHSLVNHKGKVFTYIPYQSMSAGTLIALASDEIYMDKNAYCGPIDPQMWFFSAVDVVKYCEEYLNDQSILGSLAKLFYRQSQSAIDRVMNVIKGVNDVKMIDYNTDLIQNTLLSGKYNHDTPLFAENMMGILPNVKVGIPDDLMDLYNSFNKC